MRNICALSLFFLLTGCAALPPVVTFATWALGGVTYAVSGKTVSDHAVSSVTQKDCAFLRILDSQPVCRAYADGEKPLLVAYSGEEIYPTGFEEPSPFDGKPEAEAPEAIQLAGGLPELTTAAGPAPRAASVPGKAPARPVPISGATSGTELDKAGVVAARVKTATGSIWASELIGDVWPMVTRTGRATTQAAAASPVAAKSMPAPSRPGKSRLADEPIVAPPVMPRRRPLPTWAPRAPIQAQAAPQRGTMEFAAPPLSTPVPTPVRATKSAGDSTPTATAQWHFVVIGSFADSRNAAARAAQFRGMGPEILSAEIDGRHYSRVVVGPFRADDLSSAKLQIRAVGIADAWSMPAIGGTWNRSNTLPKSDS